MSDNLVVLVIHFRNILLIGQRSMILLFLWLLLQFNHLRSKVNEAIVNHSNCSRLIVRIYIRFMRNVCRHVCASYD